MLWILMLHVAALVCWGASLLYLPFLAATIEPNSPDDSILHRPFDSIQRFVFTHVATPVAILAIMSGTIVFLLDRNISPWLIIKLSLVVGLVICHALLGLLIQKGENLRQRIIAAEDAKTGVAQRWLRRACLALGLLILLLILSIIWLVLIKPTVVWPW